MTRPALEPDVRLYTAPDEGAVFERGLRRWVLRGPAVVRLVPFLSGEHTAGEIVDRLEADHGAAELYYALLWLEERGLVFEADRGGGRSAGGARGTRGPRRRADAACPSVALRTVGEVPAAACRRRLEHLGIVVDECAEPTVVLTDDYLRPEIAALERRARRQGRSWVLARPLGNQAWIGPLFAPRAGGCWRCLARQLRGHRPLGAAWREGAPAPGGRGSDRLPRVGRAALDRLARGLAGSAGESVRDLSGVVTTIDAGDLAVGRHRVIRYPGCPACGNPTVPTRHAPAALRLESVPKAATADAVHRSASPHEVLDRYGHLVSPIGGVVSDLEEVTAEGFGGLHVHAAHGHYHAGEHLEVPPPYGVRRLSLGRGSSEPASRASALAEALERHSGTFHGDEPRVRARRADLDGAIHPNRCMLFSEAQYAGRSARSRTPTRFARVPLRFDESAPIDWTPLRSLSHGTQAFLPTMYLYFGYPARADRRFCDPDSNGNASGSVVEEAIVHGLLELVERDAVALWWYNRIRRPSVDLDAVRLPAVSDVRERYATIGRELWVLDLTADLGIASFAAVSRRRNDRDQRIVFGFGAHLDPVAGLRSAIAEMNQMRVMASEATRRGAVGPADQRRWLETATLEEHPYLAPSRDPPRGLAELPALASDDLRDDAHFLVRRMGALGLDVLALDQTRPELGLPVVKVVVPGLRHFWARFAEGRLYDVPVARGWLPRARSEAELNSVPLFV